jgi:hypothetical protein
VSNLLAGLPLKQCTAAQLEATESSPSTSKFESDLPGWEDANFNATQADRRGAAHNVSEQPTAVRNGPAPTKKIILP